MTSLTMTGLNISLTGYRSYRDTLNTMVYLADVMELVQVNIAKYTVVYYKSYL